MIVQNCIFLAFYFVQTVNFMLIESTNKISPSYYVNHTYSLSYVKTVNNLITYNLREIKISEKEIAILTSPVQTYNDTKGREMVFDKFKKKIEDIKCTCSLIVKTKLLYLSNILEGLKSGGAIEVAKDKLTVLKEEAGLIVLLFQRGQYKTGKWFWSYYFKIMAIIKYESNKNFIGEPIFQVEELQSGITDFINYCKDNKYLPKHRNDYELESKNSNVPNNIFKELRSSSIIAVEYVNIMQYISIEYLYLKPLWDEGELLYSQITGSVIDWSPTIRRHAVEVNKTKEFIETCQWITKPFGQLSYYKLIKQIISVRMYTYLWIFLVKFNKEMSKIDVGQTLITLNHAELVLLYWKARRTIEIVQRFMHYTEDLFFDIVAEFRCAMNDNQNNFDSIIARISARVNDLLVELNGCNSNGSDWISIDINGEFTYTMLLAFVQEFSDNFYLLNEKLPILNYELSLSILVEGN